MYEDAYEGPYEQPYEDPYEPRRVQLDDPPAGAPALRHALRAPVALALLVSGALHLPKGLGALRSAPLLAFLPLLAAVLCLGVGAALAIRDTAPVWRAGAVTAVGVVALHVCAGVAAHDPMAGAVGGALAGAWAGVVAVLCAAAGAVLAGLALRNRREDPA